jgi:hypothetical protein
MGFNVSPTGGSIYVKTTISVRPNSGHLHVSYITSTSNVYFEFEKVITGTAKGEGSCRHSLTYFHKSKFKVVRSGNLGCVRIAVLACVDNQMSDNRHSYTSALCYYCTWLTFIRSKILKDYRPLVIILYMYRMQELIFNKKF